MMVPPAKDKEKEEEEKRIREKSHSARPVCPRPCSCLCFDVCRGAGIIYRRCATCHTKHGSPRNLKSKDLRRFAARHVFFQVREKEITRGMSNVRIDSWTGLDG
jgi:hypothetical protein